MVKSRRHFLLTFCVLFSMYFLLLLNLVLETGLSHELRNSTLAETIEVLGFEYALFPAMLAGLIAWLLPAAKRTTPKRA